MHFVVINFSDFTITCSIFSKMCDELNIIGYNILAKMGQLDGFKGTVVWCAYKPLSISIGTVSMVCI